MRFRSSSPTILHALRRKERGLNYFFARSNGIAKSIRVLPYAENAEVIISSTSSVVLNRYVPLFNDLSSYIWMEERLFSITYIRVICEYFSFSFPSFSFFLTSHKTDLAENSHDKNIFNYLNVLVYKSYFCNARQVIDENRNIEGYEWWSNESRS